MADEPEQQPDRPEQPPGQPDAPHLDLPELDELNALDDLPVHEHAPVVERVHRALQDRLSETT